MDEIVGKDNVRERRGEHVITLLDDVRELHLPRERTKE